MCPPIFHLRGKKFVFTIKLLHFHYIYTMTGEYNTINQKKIYYEQYHHGHFFPGNLQFAVVTFDTLPIIHFIQNAFQNQTVTKYRAINSILFRGPMRGQRMLDILSYRSSLSTGPCFHRAIIYQLEAGLISSYR